MKIHLKKEAFSKIDAAFLVLQEDPKTPSGYKIIEEALQECFGLKFVIKGVTVESNNTPLFVMSVYPEISTINKIIHEVVTGGSKSSTLQKIWEQNKEWVLEFDERIFDKSIVNFTNRELTAMLSHEIGHVVCSNALPTRLSTVFKYEIMTSKMSNKILAKDKIFSHILSVPVLNACVSDAKNDKKAIKEEIKADEFAKKMGYQKELLSVLTKLSKHPLYPKSGNVDDNLKKTTKFVLNTMDQIKERQDNLLKKNLFSLKESCYSPTIKTVLDNYYSMLFDEHEDSSTFCDMNKASYMIERASELINEDIFKEFFLLDKKTLKPISPSEIDYIEIKINEIQSEDDKMMLISYLHSKLDQVEYQISIATNKKLVKKYNLPYSLEQLYAVKKRLQMLRERIIEFRIPEKKRALIVVYPDGYEG